MRHSDLLLMSSSLYRCNMDDISFKKAGREDVPVIMDFIRALAEYEKLEHEITADLNTLECEMFDKRGANAIIAYCQGVPCGMALYFYNFSTFLGRRGIYLEDLFVVPAYRSRGIGTLLLRELAKTAISEGCGRLEWSCLDWNTPSIGFYKSLGAQPMDDWTVYRVTGKTLEQLARG